MHLFITTSSSHFFNKTDFKQYLLTITKNIKINCLVCNCVCAFCTSKKGVQETDCQVALVLTTCFHKKMIGLVLCGVSVACNFLKTMTTEKLYQRIDLYFSLHTEFNVARYQTTIFVEFWFKKIGPHTIKLAFIDRFSDDITMPIVWFLLQIVVKFAHLNQWYNYYIHATSYNHCRLVGGVFCLILLLFEGPKLRNSISGYFRG